jgi:hypothetical protein
VWNSETIDERKLQTARFSLAMNVCAGFPFNFVGWQPDGHRPPMFLSPSFWPHQHHILGGVEERIEIIECYLSPASSPITPPASMSLSGINSPESTGYAEADDGPSQNFLTLGEDVEQQIRTIFLRSPSRHAALTSVTLPTDGAVMRVSSFVF